MARHRPRPRAASTPPKAAAADDATTAANISVAFNVHAELGFGRRLFVVGESPAFGSWDASAGAPLEWSDGDNWKGLVVLPADAPSGATEFKFVVSSEGGGDCEWEEGANRRAVVDQSAETRVIAVTGAYGGAVNVVGGGVDVTSAGGATGAGTYVGHQAPPPQQQDHHQDHHHQSTSPPPATREWRGEFDLRFMRHRDQDEENRLMHEASQRSDGGVNIPDTLSAFKTIAAGDTAATSWIQKLELTQSLVGQGKEMNKEKVAAASTYARWIGTGVLQCTEDGHHHRPNRMAEVGRDIFINMECVAGELYKHGPTVGESSRLIMRTIHPWLPSFSGEFTCSVPLTRIRDIAHRNDIPQDLKLEIKHTLQNKIHRNAGPEDLITTQIILDKVNAGDYNDDFKNQFNLFAAELKRFFNAAGALERVDALRADMEPDVQADIDELQAAMWDLESGGHHDGVAGAEGVATLRALRAATAVRKAFTTQLATGMRNDAPDDAVAQRQAYRLCDIALEELAFVVLARALAASGAGVDGEEGSAHFSGALSDPANNSVVWTSSCAAVALGLRHVAMSAFRVGECDACANELEAWSAAAATTTPIATEDDAKRVRATLQRAQRLVEAHTTALVDGYGNGPSLLGQAFRLPAHMGDTFVDSIVRAGVPFQLSRFLTPMLRASGAAAGVAAGGLAAVVLGVGVGKLVECERLEPGACGDPKDGPVVALVWSADGDEEVSAAGAHVAGVVLARDLPHLSHLAIRARQEKTPLATSEDKAAHLAASALAGTMVTLTVTSDGATLLPATEAEVAEGTEPAAKKGAKKAAAAKKAMVAVEETDALVAVPLSSATPANAGSKAATCGDLATKAAASGGVFRAPVGCVLPFGVMEACVAAAKKKTALASAIKSAESAAVAGDYAALDNACEAARDILRSIEIPPEVCASIAAAFTSSSPNARVAVRSSANVEDLAGMSAAGLYDSVLGVDASSALELSNAVKEVYASLFSRRAVLARAAAGVKQSAARMAVLTQEMVPSEVSFVVHTASTRSSDDANATSLEAEVAVGLGETLASGARGTPWRLEVDKTTGATTTTSFASIGSALVLHAAAAHLGVKTESVDYSRQALSVDAGARAALGAKLKEVGVALETAYGAPQDIEGGVVDGEVYVVQSRPQPL